MKKIGAFLITFGFSCLVTIAFFSIVTTNMQIFTNQCEQQKVHLQAQIDSLENVINTTFKNQKDTIIINIHPQDVRVYNYERTTRH